jgi:hypothetical protein
MRAILIKEVADRTRLPAEPLMGGVAPLYPEYQLRLRELMLQR